MKTQLLCTFTSKEELQNTLQEIRETYHIVYNYIYVLQNNGNLDEMFITYNIDTAYKPTYPLREIQFWFIEKNNQILFILSMH